MRLRDIDCLAYSGEPMPNDTTHNEQRYYRDVRGIYAAVKYGVITVEQGKKEKQQAIEDFRQEELHGEMVLVYSGLWNRIDQYSYAYRKNRTLENADAFMDAVYGVKHDFKKEENI